MLRRLTPILLLLLYVGCQAVEPTVQPTTTPIPTTTPLPPTATPTSLPTATRPPFLRSFTLGASTGGHPIEGWHLGYGERQIALVGGIHGGAEWNTILLSFALIDHYAKHSDLIPNNVTLTIIPVVNPDGQLAVMGKIGRFTPASLPVETSHGRFNANKVDLNRNWDCQWRSEAVWGGRRVSGGSAPFSEVETVLLRDYLHQLAPEVAVFYHSVADGVYTGQCGEQQHPHTLRYSASYARAANYKLNTTFAAYTVTGDATDYLNKVGIAAFTVELTADDDIEWMQNLAGVQLLLNRVAE